MIKSKKKLLFITFADPSRCQGHVSRMHFTAPSLAQEFDIHLIVLSRNHSLPEKKLVTAPYSSFTFFPQKTHSWTGWKITNADEIADFVLSQQQAFDCDAVILHMESLDLILELDKKLLGICPFAVVFNSIPFVVTPANPSWDFEKDVAEILERNPSYIDRQFIIDNAHNMSKVFSESINIICTNQTVEWYIKGYFPQSQLYTVYNSICFPKDWFEELVPIESREYDLCYMARLGNGKGIEHLETILEELEKYNVFNPLSMIIIGKADDDNIRQRQEILKQRYPTIKWMGWSDYQQKKEALSLSRVFIYPSDIDTQGIVNAEALGRGLPVVTWDLPYSRVGYRGVPGILRVPFGDYQSFAAHVYLASKFNMETRQVIKDFAESRFDISKAFAEERDIYSRICDLTK